MKKLKNKKFEKMANALAEKKLNAWEVFDRYIKEGDKIEFYLEHPEIYKRAEFIKNEMRKGEIYLDKVDLCKILEERLRDPETLSKDIPALAGTLSKMQGWDVAEKKQIEIKQQHILLEPNNQKVLPSIEEEIIDI